MEPVSSSYCHYHGSAFGWKQDHQQAYTDLWELEAEPSPSSVGPALFLPTVWIVS